MKDKLQRIQLNLSVLEAIRAFDKLRIIAHDTRSSSPTTTATDPDDKVTIDTHRLAIDERYWLQGRQRAWTGDGHGMTIAFVRHILLEVTQIANCAFQQYYAQRQQSESAIPASLFDNSPLEVLQSLSQSLVSAQKGLERLKHTTYSDSSQIGLDIMHLLTTMDKASQRISTFLLNPTGPNTLGMSQMDATWPHPPETRIKI